jgi:hypothetical protein
VARTSEFLNFEFFCIPVAAILIRQECPDRVATPHDGKPLVSSAEISTNVTDGGVKPPVSPQQKSRFGFENVWIKSERKPNNE